MVFRTQPNNLASRACRESASILVFTIYNELLGGWPVFVNTDDHEEREKSEPQRGYSTARILAWTTIAVVSALIYPSPDGNTIIEMIALIGLPLLGGCLLLIGVGIERLVRARRLSRSSTS